MNNFFPLYFILYLTFIVPVFSDAKSSDFDNPIELAKIKQLITNMFDYKTSLPSSASSANSPANMAASIASKAAEKVKENVKSAFANKLGSFNPSDQQKEIIKKVASTSFKGGRKTPNNKQRHNKTKKKKQY